jgi:hypothetical protein
MLDKILGHFVDFFGIARDLFMINAAPHKSIKLIVGVID